MQFAPISKLSEGGRRRLYLLWLLMEAPSVVLLDEPTNDLDIPPLVALEEYLDTFSGSVIAVSHDRYSSTVSSIACCASKVMDVFANIPVTTATSSKSETEKSERS